MPHGPDSHPTSDPFRPIVNVHWPGQYVALPIGIGSVRGDSANSLCVAHTTDPTIGTDPATLCGRWGIDYVTHWTWSLPSPGTIKYHYLERRSDGPAGWSGEKSLPSAPAGLPAAPVVKTLGLLEAPYSYDDPASVIAGLQPERELFRDGAIGVGDNLDAVPVFPGTPGGFGWSTGLQTGFSVLHDGYTSGSFCGRRPAPPIGLSPGYEGYDTRCMGDPGNLDLEIAPHTFDWSGVTIPPVEGRSWRIHGLMCVWDLDFTATVYLLFRPAPAA